MASKSFFVFFLSVEFSSRKTTYHSFKAEFKPRQRLSFEEMSRLFVTYCPGESLGVGSTQFRLLRHRKRWEKKIVPMTDFFLSKFEQES